MNIHGGCPHCLSPLPEATPTEEGGLPKAGDLSICIYCAAPLVFTAREVGELGLRLMTREDFDGLCEEDAWNVSRAQQATMLYRSMRAPRFSSQ